MNFKELKVWQMTKEFVKRIYEVTDEFPKEEQYEMVSRIRRAAVSAPNNIAKGCQGNTDEELIYYLGLARKNQADVESSLIISKELGILDETTFKEVNEELDACQRMTYGFMRYYKNKRNDDGEKDDSTVVLTPSDADSTKSTKSVKGKAAA